MTKNFQDMLYLYQCSIRGTEPEPEKDIDLQAVYTLARQQSVWPLVFLSVKKAFAVGRIKADSKLIDIMEEKLLISVTKGATRKEILKVILEELKEEGIRPVLLKGDTLSELYAYPEYRLSGDIDLFLNEQDEKQIFNCFEKYGFTIQKRMNKEHHSAARHPAAGVVELHVALYDDYCQDIWFGGKPQILEEYQELVTKDGYVYDVLGINDQFIYNTMHMIKHFLSGGAGIRQISDVLLFIERYKSGILFERYEKLMKELGFDKFMDCCMDIGVRYLGFSGDNLYYINKPEQRADMAEDVINDIEKCGVFGFNDTDLRDFKMTYLQRRYQSQRGGDVSEYWKKRLGFKDKLGIVFMNREALLEKYPYVEKSPLLVPAAWAHRLIKYIFCREETVPDDKKKDTHNQRLALLEKLNMI